MASDRTRGRSGGAAAQSGSRYESRVAAWYCVRMIAGSAAQPPLDLPTGTRFVVVRCQTEAPVDDVLVETSHSGFVFVQAKSGLRLDRGTHSPLRSAIDQFVRQWKACAKGSDGARWARPVDRAKDRLVLATTSSSDRVTTVLPRLLQRLRDHEAADGLRSVSLSAD